MTFEITESKPSKPGVPEPNVYSVQDGLDPETARPGKTRKTVNKDQLLATLLAKINGREYTLREIVLFEANVMGGVHAGSPKEEKEKVLQVINSSFISLFLGNRVSVRQPQATGRVILRGLEPLRSAILEKKHRQTPNIQK